MVCAVSARVPALSPAAGLLPVCMEPGLIIQESLHHCSIAGSPQMALSYQFSLTDCTEI